MEFIISFFRDILDGPLYTTVAIVCGILICSCIGYLGEQYLNKQKEKKEFNATHASVSTNDVVDSSSLISDSTQQMVSDGNIVTQNVTSVDNVESVQTPTNN